MSPNTQSEGKFVKRFEEAAMQFAILEKATTQDQLTRENINQMFKGNMQMKYDHVDHCLDILTRENHLKKEGNAYRITDDGREDVQQVQRLAMELANVAQQSTSASSSPRGNMEPQQGQPKGGPGKQSHTR